LEAPRELAPASASLEVVEALRRDLSRLEAAAVEEKAARSDDLADLRSRTEDVQALRAELAQLKSTLQAFVEECRRCATAVARSEADAEDLEAESRRAAGLVFAPRVEALEAWCREHAAAMARDHDFVAERLAALEAQLRQAFATRAATPPPRLEIRSAVAGGDLASAAPVAFAATPVPAQQRGLLPQTPMPAGSSGDAAPAPGSGAWSAPAPHATPRPAPAGCSPPRSPAAGQHGPGSPKPGAGLPLSPRGSWPKRGLSAVQLPAGAHAATSPPRCEPARCGLEVSEALVLRPLPGTPRLVGLPHTPVAALRSPAAAATAAAHLVNLRSSITTAPTVSLWTKSMGHEVIAMHLPRGGA